MNQPILFVFHFAYARYHYSLSVPKYSDTSIKNTVLRPNRQYKASTAEVAEYRYS